MNHYTMLYKYGERARNFFGRFYFFYYYYFFFLVGDGGVFLETISLLELVGYEFCDDYLTK